MPRLKRQPNGNDARRAKVTAKKAAVKEERRQRIAARAARNKDIPGVHCQYPLLENYTNEERETFLRECDDEAFLTKTKAMSQRSNTKSTQHVYIYDLLQRPIIRSMVNEVLAYCKKRNDARVFDGSLDNMISFFSEFGINILSFYDNDRVELQERFETDVQGGFSIFLKRMMVYGLKSEQLNCGKCDEQFDGKRYGARNGEANHIFDDTAKKDSERRKSFTVSAENFTRDVCDLLFELCKIDMECVFCHNKFGACRKDELHPTCVGKYDWVDDSPARLPFEVEQTKEFRRVLRCIESLSKTPLSLSFDDVCNGFENSTDFFAKDCFYFTKARWDSANSQTRLDMLHRALLSVQKRMCGRCLQCGEKFWHRPGRELVGIDMHHIKWDSKLFNPSEGAQKSFGESLGENRKCGPLCRTCHLKVHNKPGENDRFVAMLGSNGYVIDSVTGEMSRRSPVAML